MALLTKVRTTFEIHARRKATGLLEGQYASTVTGRSLDFSDLREYVVGDDVKDFDWKATARHGQPQVRRYVADRKHTVMLVVAAGRDLAGHATLGETKREVAVMAAGMMGYLATRHGDFVGLLATRGGAVEAVRPSTKELDLERMLRLVDEGSQADAQPADLRALLEFAVGALRRRTIMVVVVDDIELTPVVHGLLRRLLVQHEVYLLVVADLPAAGAAVADREVHDVDGEQVPAWLRTDHDLARELAEQTSRRAAVRDEQLTRLGIPHATITSSDEVIGQLFALLGRHRASRR